MEEAGIREVTPSDFVENEEKKAVSNYYAIIQFFGDVGGIVGLENIFDKRGILKWDLSFALWRSPSKSETKLVMEGGGQ